MVYEDYKDEQLIGLMRESSEEAKDKVHVLLTAQGILPV